MANNDLASSSVYKQCQLRMLGVQIDIKYRDYRNAKKQYQSSLEYLMNCTSSDLYQHLHDMIIDISVWLLLKKENGHEKKLVACGLHSRSAHRIDRKVVTNLSSRSLSDNEIDCLAHGLDYGLLPKRVNEMNLISNVEKNFHRITGIDEYNKKLVSELKQKDVVVDDKVRILNTKEMALASSLRSITDSFRFEANRFRHHRYKIDPDQQKYRNILKTLKEESSIIVTRPDKGRGVVLLDKSNYLSKMHMILNDESKFKPLLDDPTIKRENSLLNLLKRLLNQGYITKQFFYMAKPRGLNPGRLYGLPKIHRKKGAPIVDSKNVAFRPVLSAIGTFNYGLGKALSHMLLEIIEKKNIVKDSFTFVEELKSIKSLSNYKMVSFDVTSLYTNVPLNKTIEIILNHLYEGRATTPTIKRPDMKKLLDFATKFSHFLFDGQIFDQVDGVSMGSPLAPILAEIFLQDFEKNHLASFKTMGIVYWKRYVDDTFVLHDSTCTIEDICSKLSQYHPSLKFTSEDEELPTQTLSFLDILIQRKQNDDFQTRIYRKPSFTGLITKWDSFLLKTYKRNAISSLMYRAIKICSSYPALHEECEFIRKLATNNGYSISFVDSIIHQQLNLKYTPRAPPPPTISTDTLVMRVPYFGKASKAYGKRITSTVAKQYPLKKIYIIYDVRDRIGTGFTTKDYVPRDLKSGVVYETTCSTCNESYIGKTSRHLTTRIQEHLDEQRQLLPPSVKRPQDPITTNNSCQQFNLEKKGPLTRSQTGKLPKQRVDLYEDDLEDVLGNINLTNEKGETIIPKSAIAKHYVSTGHVIKSEDFEIRLSEQNEYPLLVKETLLILDKQPILNKTEHSTPLYVFPEGIRQLKNEQENKRIAIARPPDL